MTLLLYVSLALLLAGSVLWFRSKGAQAVKAWSLILLLITVVIASTFTPPLEPQIVAVLRVLLVFIGSLGGSVPAMYCLGLLKPHQQEMPAENRNIHGKLGPISLKAILSAPHSPAEASGGGRLIGILERLAVVLALTTSQVSLLAVIVAVKGLARYPEIKSGQLTAEKFIVGTFSSLLWAAGCAMATVNLA